MFPRSFCMGVLQLYFRKFCNIIIPVDSFSVMV